MDGAITKVWLKTFIKTVLQFFRTLVDEPITKVWLKTFTKLVPQSFRKLVNETTKVWLTTFSKLVLQSLRKLMNETFTEVLYHKTATVKYILPNTVCKFGP